MRDAKTLFFLCACLAMAFSQISNQVKKNPGVDTSFLPDEQREKRDEELREELKQKVRVRIYV